MPTALAQIYGKVHGCNPLELAGSCGGGLVVTIASCGAMAIAGPEMAPAIIACVVAQVGGLAPGCIKAITDCFGSQLQKENQLKPLVLAQTSHKLQTCDPLGLVGICGFGVVGAVATCGLLELAGPEMTPLVIACMAGQMGALTPSCVEAIGGCVGDQIESYKANVPAVITPMPTALAQIYGKVHGCNPLELAGSCGGGLVVTIASCGAMAIAGPEMAPAIIACVVAQVGGLAPGCIKAISDCFGSQLQEAKPLRRVLALAPTSGNE